ncbi:MAG TPA: metallophosphoesterase [Cytophagaceae bacterium]
MWSTSIAELLFIILGTLLILILYYLYHRKKRKPAFYTKEERNWQFYLPEHSLLPVYSVFLIGDTGAPSIKPLEPTLVLLKSKLVKAGKDSAVFFLGDNIYPKGMPKKNHPFYEKAIERLNAQLSILDNYEGRVCFISGNHDWNKGRPGGLKAVLRQQKYIEQYFGRKDVFLPRNGCPGPVEIPVNDVLTIVVINTQWWVQVGHRPIGAEEGCSIETESEFFTKLEEILDKNKDKRILVCGHHPMYSKAYHGGRFDLREHLFPLTAAHEKLYIPLPLAGSLYPIYRKYIGAREDMAHPRYKQLRSQLICVFRKYENLIYAAGHDHNLQYIRKDNQHYIVSGAGCKVTYVQRGKGAYFTHAHKGFFRLDFYKDGTVWMEVWEPEKGTDLGKLVYRKELTRMDIKVIFKEE